MLWKPAVPQIFAMVKLAMKDMALSSTQIRAARRSMPKKSTQVHTPRPERDFPFVTTPPFLF
jgi:hypothetical protein